MKLRTIAAAACVSLAAASAASALTVTVKGADYDVTTITGFSFATPSVLKSQLWWGDQGVAEDFATAVAGGLGLPNFTGSYGPFFAYSEVDIGADIRYSSASYVGAFGLISYPLAQRSTASVWAVATPVAPVPLPAGAFLLLTGLGGAAALKRRKKRAA